MPTSGNSHVPFINISLLQNKPQAGKGIQWPKDERRQQTTEENRRKTGENRRKNHALMNPLLLRQQVKLPPSMAKAAH